PADRKYTYEFKKWKKQSEDAKGNLVYKATYTKTLKPTTTIVVNDEDGNPVAGATVTVVCGDKEVASYTTDGKENKTVVLEPGECTVNVDAPEGYEDPEDTEVTPGEDTEITVKHSTYTVTYVDWKDKVVRKDTVRVDKTAPAAPAGPVRPADGKYTYEFKEWKKQSEDAKGNLVYKATYTKTLKPTTTVVVNDEDGNPVVGATVTVVCDGKEVASYTTDGTENKTVVLEPGECTVHVDAPDGYDDPADKPAVPGGNTEFTVEKTKQDVTVEIVDSKTGEKLDGKVDIYDSEGNKVATGVKSGDTVKLPKGEYTVEQSGDITGYNPAASEHFSVTNKAETVTLTAVAKPSQVVITVTDKDNHLPIDATATIVCGSLKQTVVAQNGKLVFNADTGTCTVTLSADGYKSDTLTLTIPGKGQSVARDAQLTREAIARGGLYGDEINGAKGNKNNVINKGNVNNPNVKAVPGSYGNGGGGSMLARTGGAVGGGLTAAAMLLLAGIFLVAKRRTES
ncbi:MAG: carboxypeptidase regulatory-like domain-containing protein, partial [Actinomycetaceae bacterium]|nr:carboxypeptidase regulatory-like domain-containing protein [Actinomycetaceae bacterium]